MPIQWNSEAEARLFSLVLYHHAPKLDYATLAKHMGTGVTPKAISQHIAKIKERAKSHIENNQSVTSNNGPAANLGSVSKLGKRAKTAGPKSSRPRKIPKSGGGGGGGGGGRGAAAGAGRVGGEYDYNEAPVMKSEFKMEEEDWEDGTPNYEPHMVVGVAGGLPEEYPGYAGGGRSGDGDDDERW